MAPHRAGGTVASAGGPEFRPLPLLGNAHVQTVLGTWLQGPVFRFTAQERPVVLSDGDRLLLHDTMPADWRPGQGIALLVHGLSGSHSSGYMLRLARLLLPRGLRVLRLDLRGSGRGLALARGSYNGACSGDVRAALAELARACPSSPVALIGFSLGGNIVLKLAGEAATHPVPNLACVAAVSPPIDFVQCAALLALPRNRLYELHFLRSLIRQVRQRQRLFPDLPQVRFPRRMTIRLFDDLYTAPRGGFEDALDYYRRAASLPLLPFIRVPTLLLTARDDPFIAVEPFESVRVPPNVLVQIVPGGGHLGFLGWDGAGGIRWAERRIADWVTQNDSLLK
jgi:predicted alpha/beta-fold hydrolase